MWGRRRGRLANGGTRGTKGVMGRPFCLSDATFRSPRGGRGVSRGGPEGGRVERGGCGAGGWAPAPHHCSGKYCADDAGGAAPARAAAQLPARCWSRAARSAAFAPWSTYTPRPYVAAIRVSE